MKYFLSLFILFFIGITKTVHLKDFKGAEYRTKDSYKYGRFEVRYKSADKEGVLASFFTYFDGTPEDPWESSKWNEIDVEILGRYENDVQFNPITPGQMSHVRHQFVNFNPHIDFHTYAFEWTPDYVAWFIDNEEMHRQTGDHILTLIRAQKIMMNIWNPAYDNWAGDFNPDALPAFAYYDWVRYYSYTPGSGNYGTGNNFTHAWTDEFDSWDQNKWEKATHTWNGNNCDFIRENAVFRDGMLILCLTDTVNVGFNDVKKPELLWARTNNEYDKILASFSEELDQTTAGNKANYNIPAVTIDSAVLLPNKKTVELTVSGMNPAGTYNLIVMNIKDKAPIPNTISADAVTIIKAEPLAFPIKINAGGSAAEDYLKDQEWSSSVEYGYLDGSISEWDVPVSGTEEDSVYLNDRYGLVTYNVRVPAGIYNVKLMFAEKYFNQPDKRIFDVYIENNKAVDDLDIYSHGYRTAYEITITDVSVNDGILEIHFGSEINNPLINGIVIENKASGLLDDDPVNLISFGLFQNYPNPFNPSTKISYTIPRAVSHKGGTEGGFVTLKVYDILGNEIATLVNEEQIPGEHDVEFSALSLSAGVYVYSLSIGNLNKSKKMILLK
ncbi:MAG: family 16 glycosylhydrolase [Ignavibacteria bacterium]